MKLLALYYAPDGYSDEIDAALTKAFEAPVSVMKDVTGITHCLNIERNDDDIVEHLSSHRKMTVEALAELLKEHCAFVRESEFLITEDDKLEEIRN